MGASLRFRQTSVMFLVLGTHLAGVARGNPNYLTDCAFVASHTLGDRGYARASLRCDLGRYYCDTPIWQGKEWCEGKSLPDILRGDPNRPGWGELCCPVGQVPTGQCDISQQRCRLAPSVPTALAVPVPVPAAPRPPTNVTRPVTPKPHELAAIPLINWSPAQIGRYGGAAYCEELLLECSSRCWAGAGTAQNVCINRYFAQYDSFGCPVLLGLAPTCEPIIPLPF